MGKKVVFIGPSFSDPEGQNHTDIDFKPPVSCGDVYRAARDGASCIAIIDGVFEQQRAVWHKEILWALSQGIPVFGASSMGALRALELAPYGMVGIGRIFNWYLDGTVCDDGEVAVVHAPEDLGYRAMTEPLVNVRATLLFAKEQSVLTDETCAIILKAARSMHYKERTRAQVLRCIRDVLADEEKSFSWLESNWVDQKQKDALELLACLKDETKITAAPTFEFTLEQTVFWQLFRASMESSSG